MSDRDFSDIFLRNKIYRWEMESGQEPQVAGDEMSKSYSPRHKSVVGKAFNGRKAIEDLYKYDDWKSYRLRFLSANPRCYVCGFTATVVDHLRPHQGDEKLFRQLDNHIPLCETCHNRVTAIYDRKFRVGGSIQSKIEWMQWNRAAKDLTFRIKVLTYYE